MDKLATFIDALKREVENHSIYVWSGSGQLCKNITEKWIREKESRSDGGKHADDAVAAWNDVMSSPYADVARVFDCSGYVSYCLIQANALDKRRDCDGLYDRCTPLQTPENGALLFKVSSTNPNDETHVGAYYDGYVYESKGRAYGVVKSEYKAKDWKKIAWFKALEKDDPQPEPPEPEPIPSGWYVKILGGSVRVRKGGSVLYKTIGIAHRGERYPLLGTADSGWYMIGFEDQVGYITNKPKYTEVIEYGE